LQLHNDYSQPTYFRQLPNYTIDEEVTDERIMRSVKFRNGGETLLAVGVVVMYDSQDCAAE
jgi:hypothetical protein